MAHTYISDDTAIDLQFFDPEMPTDSAAQARALERIHALKHPRGTRSEAAKNCLGICPLLDIGASSVAQDPDVNIANMELMRTPLGRTLECLQANPLRSVDVYV